MPDDDTSIVGDTILWRRIPQDQCIDDKMRGRRPTSKAFQNATPERHAEVMGPFGYTHDPGMSVDIASETTEENFIKNNPVEGIVEFPVSLIRDLNQGIIRTPIPDDPAHCEVMGKKTQGVQKRLYRECVWVKEPDECLG